MTTSSTVRAATRQAIAVSFYWSLLKLALLVAAFNSFPNQKVIFGLAVLVFSQGIAAVNISQSLIAANQNRIDDLAERKTRHTILLAHENWSGPSFWSECDRRVTEEIGEPLDSSPWWMQILMTIAVFGKFVALDLIVIAMASFFSN